MAERSPNNNTMITFYALTLLFVIFFWLNSFDLIEIPVDLETGITPLLSTQYRLSRVHNAGDDYQRYNRVVLFGVYGNQGNAKFVEGFGAEEVIVECNTSVFQFRKQTSTPIELYEFEKFKVIGDYRGAGPQLRSWLSLTTVPWGLDVSYEHDVFNVRLRDTDASHGQEIEAYNSTEEGTNTNIKFYDRDVKTVGRQRNILHTRPRINSSPPPEAIIEPMFETL